MEPCEPEPLAGHPSGPGPSQGGRSTRRPQENKLQGEQTGAVRASLSSPELCPASEAGPSGVSENAQTFQRKMKTKRIKLTSGVFVFKYSTYSQLWRPYLRMKLEWLRL